MVSDGTLLRWYITLRGLFNIKVTTNEEQQMYNLTYSWGYKRVHTSPNGFSPKMNIIAQLELEHAYDGVENQNFNHDTACILWRDEIIKWKKKLTKSICSIHISDNRK